MSYYEIQEKKAVNQILQSINTFADFKKTDFKKIANLIANDHPTLQQSFMRLAMEFIRIESDKTENQYDLRNEATIKLCQLIKEKLPYEDFNGRLPLI